MQDPEVFGELANQVLYTPGAPFAKILGRKVHVLGASDSKAEKTIRGLTLSGAYVDEVTILTEEFFTQLLGRMSVDGAQCFITTNPDSPHHWFKKKFLDKINNPNVEKPIEDWKSWYFELDDNPTLTESYKDSIKAEFTGLFYKRFIEGKWVAAEGAVYDMWQDEKHVIPWEDIPPIERYVSIGIDYGTTNTTSAVLLALAQNIHGPGKALYMVDEWRYTPGNAEVRKTDAELSEGIREWIGNYRDKAGLAIATPPIIVDPAAASFRMQLLKDGIRTHSADNDVLNGIRVMSTLLATGKLYVSDRCTGLIEEMPGYSWDAKATNEGKDQVIKVNDHSLDAARYSTFTTRNLWRKDINPNERL